MIQENAATGDPESLADELGNALRVMIVCER